jgi:RHS repeat-associated protein
VNGNAMADYTYGIGLISQQRNNVTSFYHADGLGSTRYLTNSSGSVTDSYLYDAYGNTLSSSGTTVNNYLYTGEQFDPNLREYYLRARYYNPSQGRFTGRDPFDGMLSEPLSLNKYAYVHGNPINNIDPTGMFTGNIGELLATLEVQGTLLAQNVATPLVITRNIAGVSVNVLRNLDLVQQVQLIVSEYTLRNCNIEGTKDCNAGIPIMFSGDEYQGKPLTQTTQHISSAIIFGGKKSLLTAWAIKPTYHGMHEGVNKWFKFTKECDKEGMPDGLKKLRTCDEYPFFSTNEGGEANYIYNRVSLALVPMLESGPQGSLVGRAEAAGVQKGVPFLNWFGVVAIPGMKESYWLDRSRTKIP